MNTDASGIFHVQPSGVLKKKSHNGNITYARKKSDTSLK